jgi:hypothetical protein
VDVRSRRQRVEKCRGPAVARESESMVEVAERMGVWDKKK